MIIWFILFIVKVTNGLPAGAPKSACTTLLPRHSGLTAQTTTVPYIIHAELSDNKINVNISSPVGEIFEGFVLQARSATDPSKFIDGEFTVSQVSKTIDCFDGKKNTLTHVNPSQKNDIITEWTPKERSNEEVIFRGTIAKKFDIFWADVDSNPVKLMSDSSSAIKEESLYEKCFKEEGCVGLPDGCVEQHVCEVLLKYSKSSDGINFNLQGNLEGPTKKYMAMAWSDDPIMGEDSVTECIRDGTNVIARESWNEGKSNTRTRELSKDSYAGTYVDGLTSCKWKSPLITVSNGITYDFANNSYYILLATGDVAEWRLKFHDRKISFSPEALRLAEFHADEEVTEPKVEDTSRDTEVQRPPVVTPQSETDTTSPKEESFVLTNETLYEKSSSCSTGICSFLFIVLIIVYKESISYVF